MSCAIFHIMLTFWAFWNDKRFYNCFKIRLWVFSECSLVHAWWTANKVLNIVVLEIILKLVNEQHEYMSCVFGQSFHWLASCFFRGQMHIAKMYTIQKNNNEYSKNVSHDKLVNLLWIWFQWSKITTVVACHHILKMHDIVSCHSTDKT